MKRFTGFIFKLFLVAAPLWLLCLCYLITNPFKVFGGYDTYYKDDVVSFGVSNRDFLSTEAFIHNYGKYNYDSFVFGSSRSLSFQCSDWERYINSPAFHFDASGESIYGILTKLRFLRDCNVKIKNCLIILDSNALSQTVNSEGYSYIKHPSLSHESRVKFHFEFLRLFLNNQFFIPYFAYLTGKKIPDFFEYPAVTGKWTYKYNRLTNDIIYSGQEKMITENADDYYGNKQTVFYSRDTLSQKFYGRIIHKEQAEMLNEIKHVLLAENTDYSIVLYPDYDLKKYDNDDLYELKRIFEENRIYDYSGINKYTKNLENYIDNIHARSRVGNLILSEIYSKKSIQ